MACFFLSNVARQRNLPEFDDEIPPEDDMNEDMDERPDWAIEGELGAREKLRLRRQGFLKRDTITANDFTR